MGDTVGLFQVGQFQFSSGVRSPFKFECDEMTDDEIAALAFLGSHQICHFADVVPVPKGKSGSEIDNAKRFAKALDRYAKPGYGITLLVDDVLTTGASMEAARAKCGSAITVGLVMFAYKRPASWITPVLQASPTVGMW